MRAYFYTVLLIAGSVAAVPTWADDAKSSPEQRIDQLIRKLGSNRFSEREKARHELETLGLPAVEALRKATKSPDLETSRRAGEILRILEIKITTARFLTPKKVHLNFQNASIRDAVRELEKQSGYKIQVQGKPSEKKLTMDTGLVTFWEALDQLCTQAGLVEITAPLPIIMPSPIQAVPVQKVLPRGFLPVVPPPPPVQPQKVPFFQVQAAPPAPQPIKVMPAVPGGGGFGSSVAYPMANTNPRQIVLVPGTARKLPTCYNGAVRNRLAPAPASMKRSGEFAFILEANGEPNLIHFQVDSNPRIDRSMDEHGQTLKITTEKAPSSNVMASAPIWVNPPNGGKGKVVMMPPSPMVSSSPMVNSQVVLRLKLGEKEAKVLKELKGVLNAQVLKTNETLITVNNILQAGGKTIQGEHGGSIQVQGVEKTANGQYQMRISLVQPPVQNQAGMMPGLQFQQIQMQAGGIMRLQVGGNFFAANSFPTNQFMPRLVDKNGKRYQLVSVPSQSMSVVNGQVTRGYTLVFRANNNQGAPERLEYHGQRAVTFQVPFTFKDVPLQ